ncbi:MAG: hypothetical protein IKJ39_11615 [Lachnospiraceae bacterium]|nr:hypothetical protein [Lachnospiraceae bacterium]
MKAAGRKWLCIGTLFIVTVVLIILSTPVFYLNDDVTMRSILSGAYTGTPDGHAVYIQYPLSGVLAILYRVVGFMPWMELFFVGSVFTGMVFFAESFESWVRGVLAAIAIYIPFVLYTHYTLIAALLAATACFLLAKGDKGIRSGVLLLLAFLIRGQIGLLSIPFILCAMVFRVIMISTSERKGECIRNGKWLAVLAISMLLCSAIHTACYSSAEWKEYNAYNDARTQLYDYTDFLSTTVYEEDSTDYGMTAMEYDILYSYNNMLEPSIDGERMQDIANRITESMGDRTKEVSSLKDSVYKYYLQVRYNDSPYNYIWIAMVCLNVFSCVWCKKWLNLGILGVLEIGRSIVWMYLIWKGRFPERVSVSLYLIELLLLIGMLQMIVSEAKLSVTQKKVAGSVCIGLLMVASFFEWKDTFRELEKRHQIQEEWDDLKAYCAQSSDTIYLMDVFSVVEYAETQYNRDAKNMMLLGGWLSASPLSQKVLNQMDVEDAAEALLAGKVRLLADKEKDLEWLDSYLESRFGACEWIVCDEVLLQTGKGFKVYEIRSLTP